MFGDVSISLVVLEKVKIFMKFSKTDVYGFVFFRYSRLEGVFRTWGRIEEVELMVRGCNYI